MTKVPKLVPDAKQTAARLDTWRGFATKCGANCRHLLFSELGTQDTKLEATRSPGPHAPRARAGATACAGISGTAAGSPLRRRAFPRPVPRRQHSLNTTVHRSRNPHPVRPRSLAELPAPVLFLAFRYLTKQLFSLWVWTLTPKKNVYFPDKYRKMFS